MKNYTKAVLYAYPLLKNIGEDYEEHIKNCALLSYRTSRSAEETALYIASEILKKQNFEWLKGCVERVLSRLSAVEKTLVEIRYFGKERKMKKEPEGKSGEKTAYGEWSNSKYFRRLHRISEKVGVMLEAEGLSEELFLREFVVDELFAKIYKFVCERKDIEKRWRG